MVMMRMLTLHVGEDDFKGDDADDDYGHDNDEDDAAARNVHDDFEKNNDIVERVFLPKKLETMGRSSGLTRVTILSASLALSSNFTFLIEKSNV
jgi:hypothetical protein